uniref:NADH dehydrogenase subunit 2 n=1 Tax=Pomphorhynchus rocci TaxID=1183240 RepID=A0A806GYX9_9BILA|nr:NADH dehydrogenase subunit 2 [Pomphorhynchus rocci]AFJ54220.1 NADH dehydrogenase subunit 2 [Pomphorhynchus rocci]
MSYSLVAIYFMSLWMGVRASEPFWMWVALEVGLLVVLYLGLVKGSRVGSIYEYFLVQAVGSLTMMMGLVLGSGGVVVAGVCIKVGLFPFLSWVYRVVWGVDSAVSILFILGLQKVVPFVLVFKWWPTMGVGSGLMLSCLLLSALTGGFCMLMGGGWVWVMVSSAVFHSSWVIMMCIFGMMSVVTYYMGYMLVLWALASFSGDQPVVGGGAFMWILVLLASLPPYIGFWLKMYSFVVLSALATVLVGVMAAISCVMMVGYFRGMLEDSVVVSSSGAIYQGPTTYTLPPSLVWGLGVLLMCVSL